MSKESLDHDISYLARGTPRQRRAHQALESADIFEKLSDYSPVLAGTIPLDVDVEESDLDIVCHAQDLEAFRRRLQTEFSGERQFELVEREVGGWPSVVARFRHLGFEIEIFAQERPVEEQPAYRHMLVERRLLDIGGPGARAEVRRLKRSGLATEPAFARAFGISGDPYASLMDLSNLDEEELRVTIQGETEGGCG